ncbi:unnamed protein product [Rotaria sp. Silwood1]|nr:unnamed protein product [Rotaria sp. Silwood1]
MSSRHDLTLEEKIKLIKENECGSSYRELCDRFKLSIGAVSNIIKRKSEYMSDYEINYNKNVKRKSSHDFSQRINESVYEWFALQRAKKIPMSGPILQAYARRIAQELDDASTFKASNGWLERFRTRYNINFRVISGEGASVDQNITDDWKLRLLTILQNYNPADIYNCDETGLFYKLMPDRSLVINKDDCIGKKKSKERLTILLCANWLGTHKIKPMVIGKSARPRCFKNLDLKKLPVVWHSNRTAWMNSKIFTNWLHEFDLMMEKQKRQVLLFLDNAPVHPPDITLKFFPSNSTALIQPMDQGIIRTFKAHYRRQLVQHIIANADVAYTADDIVITALDAICWIDLAWKSITESTIQNTFKRAGFQVPSGESDSIPRETTTGDEIIVAQEQEYLNDLDKVLQYVNVGGGTMSASDFIGVDNNLSVFNELDNNNENILLVNVVANDDTLNDEEPDIEQPPSLPESIQMVRRLKLLSTTQHPELHSLLIQLQSKLIDIHLDSNIVKQKSILDFFKPIQSGIVRRT